MNESLIIKSIKYYAIKQHLNGGDWHVDTLFAFLSAIIYPFLDVIKYDSEVGNIRQTVKLLSDFFRHKKTNNTTLSSLSFDGLISCFIKELCPAIPYNLKKECLIESISLIDSIGTEGYISWGGKIDVYNCIVKVYEKNAYLYEYGTESYVFPMLENENNICIAELTDDRAEIKKEQKRGSQLMKETEEEKTLNEFWRDYIYGEHYEQCMPYVWKLQISYSSYRKLKELLKSVFKVVNQSTILDHHCEKVFVYVAEWFKWEYQPNISNAFENLNINNISKEVWESLDKWQNFRYRGESNDIHLYSMYALGGFPLLAIHNSGKIDNLFDCLLNDKDDNLFALESLRKNIVGNSDAFKQSLEDDRGSWSEYVKFMRDAPEVLYADIDKRENDLVKFFYERLENGSRPSVEKDIKWNWIFYTSKDDETVSADIIVNIGRDGRDGCVAAEIVNSDSQQLYIGLECQNEIVNYRKYSKTSDCKRFVGWGTVSNRIKGYVEDLSQPIVLCKYETDLLQPSAGEVITPIRFENKYIEVYATDDGSGWTTLREFSRNEVKAVLFPCDLYDVKGDNLLIQNKVIGDKHWSFCEILETVQLVEKGTGNTYNLYQEGEVSVKITPKLDTLNYYDISKSLVKCVINAQEQYLPLMMGIPKDRCVIIHSKQINEPPKRIKLKDIAKVEYTQNHSRNDFFKTRPKPGLITLDIKEYNFKKRYIYLPQDAVKRNLKSGTIIFENLDEVTKIECISVDGTTKLLEGNVYKDINIAQLELGDVVEDTLLFRIYFSNQDYVELDIYCPINCRELKLGDQIIQRHNDNHKQNQERIKLPYILRDKFELRVFDEGGVKTISNFKDFRWFISDDTIHTCDEIDVYLYVDKQIKNESIGLLDIGSKGWEQYKFYYWSVETDTQPQRIGTSYDYDRKQLKVNTECLKNKKGLIFQSLDGCCPRHYLKAISIGETSRCGVDELDELIYKCYKVASCHKVPFSQFYPLQQVVNDIVRLRILYKRVIESNIDRQFIYTDLHRFANEFNFEWILLPISFWRQRFIDKEQAVLFMQNSNFVRTSSDKQRLGCFLKKYLTTKKIFESIDIRGRRNMTTILRYMRGLSQKNDPRIIPVSNEKVEVIKGLYESNEWISDLLRIFETN